MDGVGSVSGHTRENTLDTFTVGFPQPSVKQWGNRLSYLAERTTPLPLNYWGWGWRWGEGGDGSEYVLASGCPCILVSVQI